MKSLMAKSLQTPTLEESTRMSTMTSEATDTPTPSSSSQPEAVVVSGPAGYTSDHYCGSNNGEKTMAPRVEYVT